MWNDIIAFMQIAFDKGKVERIEAEIEEEVAAYRLSRQAEIDKLKERIAHSEMLIGRY